MVLLSLNGLTLGILYAYDDFTIGGVAPLVWNLVILAVLIPLRHAFSGPDQLYAYAIAVLAGTTVQFLITLPRLRKLGFGLTRRINLRDPRIKQVLRLMLPVTFATGSSTSTAADQLRRWGRSSATRRRARSTPAFRLYQLPQGDLLHRAGHRALPDAHPSAAARRPRAACAARWPTACARSSCC